MEIVVIAEKLSIRICNQNKCTKRSSVHLFDKVIDIFQLWPGFLFVTWAKQNSLAWWSQDSRKCYSWLLLFKLFNVLIAITFITILLTPSSFQISMNVIRQCLVIAAYSFVKIPLGVLTARALRDSSWPKMDMYVKVYKLQLPIIESDSA